MLLSYLLSNNLVEGQTKAIKQSQKSIDFDRLLSSKTNCSKCASFQQCPTYDTQMTLSSGQEFNIEDFTHILNILDTVDKTDQDDNDKDTLNNKMTTFLNSIESSFTPSINQNLFRTLLSACQASVPLIKIFMDLQAKISNLPNDNLSCEEFFDIAVPGIYFLQRLRKDDENDFLFQGQHINDVRTALSTGSAHNKGAVKFLTLLYLQEYKNNLTTTSCTDCKTELKGNDEWQQYGDAFTNLNNAIKNIIQDYKNLEKVFNSINFSTLTSSSATHSDCQIHEGE
jgi:hypothetical protein